MKYIKMTHHNETKKLKLFKRLKNRVEETQMIDTRLDEKIPLKLDSTMIYYVICLKKLSKAMKIWVSFEL